MRNSVHDLLTNSDILTCKVVPSAIAAAPELAWRRTLKLKHYPSVAFTSISEQDEPSDLRLKSACLLAWNKGQQKGIM